MFSKHLWYNKLLRIPIFHTKVQATMSVFVQKANPLTGRNDWIVQNEHYDYHQEVARSAFADMLHDTERNQLYERGLKIAIDHVHSRGQKANVLDIGTGTGLLSMMAVRNGADRVVACEAFKPMSRCALQVIELNGFRERIEVIPKRSTELTVGPEGDLSEKCNILVTEVFDTELIGEGALATFEHAHRHLLEPDSIVVPKSATVYAQIVECPLAQNWNKLKDIYDDDLNPLIRVPPIVKRCPGSVAVHDIQLSQLPLSSFNEIAPPAAVLHFDWSGRIPLNFNGSTTTTLKSTRDGRAQMVFMWWDLDMDINGEHVLSCAPYWAHPKSRERLTKDIPWRDHWMQAVYYLPQEVDVKNGQAINLISCHDEYSLWFNLTPIAPDNSSRLAEKYYTSPLCDCGLHVAFSRTRIGQLNDAKRNKRYLKIFEDNVNADSVVLFLGDGFHFGLVASKLGAEKLYFLDTNKLSRRVLQHFIDYNEIKNAVVLETVEDLKRIDLGSINMIFGEPYYSGSILPWDNLLFLYLSQSLRSLVDKEVKIFPKTCIVKGVAVQFDDLHKIRQPLGRCEGFRMKPFDDLIAESSDISDDNVEAQPLWEYPATALSPEVRIATIDLTRKFDSPIETSGEFSMERGLPCNGIALWVDWNHDGSPRGTVTTGPTEPIEPGRKIQWDLHTRQGVCLFPGKSVESLRYRFTFDFDNGSITFKYT